MEVRQRATAMYFIDVLALRAGNEKGDDEADTVGCCSLRYEHITLDPPNFLVFDFLGKDSIRYYNRVPVSDQVFKNVRIFKEQTTEGDDLFDRLTVRRTHRAMVFFIIDVVVTDHKAQQVLDELDEGLDREGVPYLQRLSYFPGAARQRYPRGRNRTREAGCLQPRQSYGCPLV